MSYSISSIQSVFFNPCILSGDKMCKFALMISLLYKEKTANFIAFHNPLTICDFFCYYGSSAKLKPCFWSFNRD